MGFDLSVGEYLLQAIKDIGVRAVFGIPGDMVIRFFKVIEDDADLDLYTFSHEPGVGFAAIGSARATQKPAVACVTYGADCASSSESGIYCETRYRLRNPMNSGLFRHKFFRNLIQDFIHGHFF